MCVPFARGASIIAFFKTRSQSVSTDSGGLGPPQRAKNQDFRRREILIFGRCTDICTACGFLFTARGGRTAIVQVKASISDYMIPTIAITVATAIMAPVSRTVVLKMEG